MSQTTNRKYTDPAEALNGAMETINGVDYLRTTNASGGTASTGSVYDNAEFNLATGQTNYAVKANQSSAFNNISTAKTVNIRTDKTITVRFNLVGNDAITIASADSPFSLTDVAVTDIFITNSSGSSAAIKILLT